MTEKLDIYKSHLREQFQRGLPVLFTGAGFSVNGYNADGQSVPSVRELKELLWRLCFPGDPQDEQSTLQDLYDDAARKHANGLRDLVRGRFSVGAESLPDWYSLYFALPWSRAYTLNIDDLDEAVARRFDLPRKVVSTSAVSGVVHATQPHGVLESIHLNGRLTDVPHQATFSQRQYGERLARGDAWYVALVADLMTRPVVFVGTSLDEPPLWQHLALRMPRGDEGLRELRPRSYLISPSLSKARESLLASYNVVWIPMTAEDFAKSVLSEFEGQVGDGLRVLLGAGGGGSGTGIVDVGTEPMNPARSSDFLLGAEPLWSDLQAGRAIERESDDRLWDAVQVSLGQTSLTVVLVTGTAGSGKSTSLMRACLRASAAGARVGWIGRESGIGQRDVLRQARADGAAPVLAIDDADLFGSGLSGLVRSLGDSSAVRVLLLGVRATKIDRVINPTVLSGIRVEEIVMPLLVDTEISQLLDLLDKENRLGVLKGRTRDEQLAVLRDRCGRQLLVAMIEATSGKKFEEKVLSEFVDLPPVEQVVYSIVATASSLRYSLVRDEVLIATGKPSNAVLNAIDQLVRRHVLQIRPQGERLDTRHRVIAEVLVDELQKAGQLREPLEGLALVAAAKASPHLDRSSRSWRLLRSLLNHDFLFRMVGREAARGIYSSLETIRAWDSHYWLQRGSLEVEDGDLDLAENFLGQAKSLAPDDPLVDTEVAYLLFRRAIENPSGAKSPDYINEARAILEGLIASRGAKDSYPFHVLGSQGLAWVRRGVTLRSAKRSFLDYLAKQMDAAAKLHPRATEILKLRDDIKRELLQMVASSG